MGAEDLKNTIEQVVPEPPFTLRDGGERFWKVLYFQLAGEGKVKPCDTYLLARYCTTLAEWEALDLYSRTHDLFEKMISNKGVEYFAKHPKISRLESIEPLLLRMEKSLGIGAGTRITKKINDDDDEADLTRILTRSKGGK